MVTRVILSSVLMLSLLGSSEMRVITQGGSNPRSCSECRFLAAACYNQETSSAVGGAKTLFSHQETIKNNRTSCCPTGTCCPDGPCCQE